MASYVDRTRSTLELRPRDIYTKITRMGMSNRDLYGDAVYKPTILKNKDDWPTLVLEAGLSESLPRLRIDAGWWLTNSGGEDCCYHRNKAAQRKIEIEKRELVP